MRLLACDIGARRTGLAFGESNDGIAMALDPLLHTSKEELAKKLETIVHERAIEKVIFGLPLLPGGGEGAQSHAVRAVGNLLESVGIPVVYLDERYSSKGANGESDGDTKAACDLLLISLSRSI